MRNAGTTVEIDAQGLHYRDLNERVREVVAGGAGEIVLRNVRGQRYIGAGLTDEVQIAIEGVPGNDLACFMNGPRVVVEGNVQDCVANTMSSGSVMVHGDAGDILGYSMRGGKVFIRGDAGYRAGIHMKAFQDRAPVMIIGGTARDYLGEYMAGGTLVVLGLGAEDGEYIAGDLAGTGMHGGEIYLRGGVDPAQIGKEVGEVEIDDACWERLGLCLAEFCGEFGLDVGEFSREQFTRLCPVSLRPYGKVYVY